MKSKWIKYLIARAETLKLPEENIRGNLFHIGLGNDLTPKTQATKAKINK